MTQPASTPAGTGEPQADPSIDPPADPPPVGQEPSGGEPQRVEDLPEWAQRIIRDIRSEAAQRRTEKQQAEAAKKAAEDRVAAIAAAAGIQAGPDTAPEDWEAAAASAQAKYWRAATDSAIYRLAPQHGADPHALRDSLAFADRIEELDPDASDFETRLGEAIKTAVTENPRYATTQQPAGSAGTRDMGQGRRTTAGPVGVAAGRDLYDQRRRKKKTPAS